MWRFLYYTTIGKKDRVKGKKVRVPTIEMSHITNFIQRDRE